MRVKVLLGTLLLGMFGCGGLGSVETSSGTTGIRSPQSSFNTSNRLLPPPPPGQPGTFRAEVSLQPKQITLPVSELQYNTGRLSTAFTNFMLWPGVLAYQNGGYLEVGSADCSTGPAGPVGLRLSGRQAESPGPEPCDQSWI